MSSIKLAGFLFSGLALSIIGLVACSQAPKQIPMRDFFKNPEKAYYQVSPDGNFISFTMPYETRMNIFVQARGSQEEPKRITSVTDRDIWQYFWKGSDRLLFMRDFGGDENFHLFAVDRSGEKTVDLTPFESTRVEMVDDLYDHPTDVIIGMNKRNKQIFDCYRLNTATGELTMIAENPGNITSWVTDHDGRILVAGTTDGVNTSLLYRTTEKDKFNSILTTSFKEQFAPMFFTFDNKNIYAASNLGRDKISIVLFDLATAKETEVLYENPEVDVENMEYSRHRKVLTVVNYTTWRHQRKFLDKETEELQTKLEKQLPGYDVYVTFMNKNE
ncbi:MAG: S9 family peptidase, partial [candidate division Zixibacteria bacterium]|nr:S9 family peptidase [candidate division Zixibacteria bacterium]